MIVEQHHPTSKSKVESFPSKTKTFTLEQLGLPQDFDQRKEVTVKVHPFVTKEPFKAVVEIAEYTPQTEIESDKKGVTVVITGGGASPGVGSNIKLGLELEKALQTLHAESPDKKTPKIDRIYFVPNITGVAREKNEFTAEKSLQYEASAALNALEQLPLGENTLMIGFSAGGTQSIEVMAEMEKRKKRNQQYENIQNLDLILLDPAGTVETNIAKMGWNFSIGGFIKALRKNRRMYSLRESFGKARDEFYLGWATRKGKIQNFKELFREFTRPQVTIEEQVAEHDIHKPIKPEPRAIPTLTNRSTRYNENYIKGNILQIQMTNAGVVNNPAEFMVEEDQFPNAKSRTAIGVLGGGHTSVMSDTKGNEPLTAAEVTTLTKTGPKTEFKRLGSGQERMNRIAGGYYSPLARLMAEWVTDIIPKDNQPSSEETIIVQEASAPEKKPMPETAQPQTFETLSPQEQEIVKGQLEQLITDILDTRYIKYYLKSHETNLNGKQGEGVMASKFKVSEKYKIGQNTQMNHWVDRRATYRGKLTSMPQPDSQTKKQILDQLETNQADLITKVSSSLGGVLDLENHDVAAYLQSLVEKPTNELVQILDDQITDIVNSTKNIEVHLKDRHDEANSLKPRSMTGH